MSEPKFKIGEIVEARWEYITSSDIICWDDEEDFYYEFPKTFYKTIHGEIVDIDISYYASYSYRGRVGLVRYLVKNPEAINSYKWFVEDELKKLSPKMKFNGKRKNLTEFGEVLLKALENKKPGT